MARFSAYDEHDDEEENVDVTSTTARPTQDTVPRLIVLSTLQDHFIRIYQRAIRNIRDRLVPPTRSPTPPILTTPMLDTHILDIPVFSVEVLDLIAQALINADNRRTYGSFSLMNRKLYDVMTPRLWKHITIDTDDFIHLLESQVWKELVLSRGVWYWRYVLIEIEESETQTLVDLQLMLRVAEAIFNVPCHPKSPTDRALIVLETLSDVGSSAHSFLAASCGFGRPLFDDLSTIADSHKVAVLHLHLPTDTTLNQTPYRRLMFPAFLKTRRALWMIRMDLKGLSVASVERWLEAGFNISLSLLARSFGLWEPRRLARIEGSVMEMKDGDENAFGKSIQRPHVRIKSASWAAANIIVSSFAAALEKNTRLIVLTIIVKLSQKGIADRVDLVEAIRQLLLPAQMAFRQAIKDVVGEPKGGVFILWGDSTVVFLDPDTAEICVRR